MTDTTEDLDDLAQNPYLQSVISQAAAAQSTLWEKLREAEGFIAERLGFASVEIDLEDFQHVDGGDRSSMDFLLERIVDDHS